jgi:hypothetical protein
MFQDSAGTIPVTGVGQPVGLMLDKSKGLVLSNELVTNGDFSAGATGWTVTNNDATHIATFSGGTLRYQSDTTTPLLNVGQAGLLSANKTFLVTVVCSAWTSGSVKVAESTLGMLIVNGVGTFTARVSTAILTSLNIQRNSTNVDLTLDSISVREIAGNHAYQTTSAARPILQDAPRRIDFDAVDDKLITNLPAQLTGCTVIRSVPNVGTHILTNQTVPTPYNDNIDNCGLIVINRALTASETSQITKLFNKAAGV